jgi:hypothetical protein
MSILKELAAAQMSTIDHVQEYYDKFKLDHGLRPTALNAFHANVDISKLSTSHGGWMNFVLANNDLSIDEADANQGVRAGFLSEIETSDMKKSFKMILLQALVDRGLPARVRISDLVSAFRKSASNMPLLVEELGNNLGSDVLLGKCIRKNPIEAWIGKQADSADEYFSYEGQYLNFNVPITDEHRSAYCGLIGELVEYRLHKHWWQERERKGVGRSLRCRVLNNEGVVHIQLPSRELNKGLPYGREMISAGAKIYTAQFNESDISSMHFEDIRENQLRSVVQEISEANVCPEYVSLERDEKGWRLNAVDAGPELLGLYYTKDFETKNIFQRARNKGNFMSGYVRLDNDKLLLVTLKKAGQPDHLDYKDRFISDREFDWESPSRTTRDSDEGQSIVEHERDGRAFRLFVREVQKRKGKTVPYIYCGLVEPVSDSSEAPIKVKFRLLNPLPPELATRFIEHSPS